MPVAPAQPDAGADGARERRALEFLTREGQERAAAAAAPPPPFDWTAAIADVCHWFPGAPWVAVAWPTADHVMPWLVFWGLYHQLGRVMAVHRVQLAQAIRLGMAASDDKAAQRLACEELETAFPATRRRRG